MLPKLFVSYITTLPIYFIVIFAGVFIFRKYIAPRLGIKTGSSSLTSKGGGAARSFSWKDLLNWKRVDMDRKSSEIVMDLRKNLFELEKIRRAMEEIQKKASKLKKLPLKVKDKIDKFMDEIEESRRKLSIIEEEARKVQAEAEKRIEELKPTAMRLVAFSKMANAMKNYETKTFVVVGMDNEYKMSVVPIDIQEAGEKGLLSKENIIIEIKEPIPPGKYSGGLFIRNLFEITSDNPEESRKYQDVLNTILGSREYLPISMSRAFKEGKFSLLLGKDVLVSVYSLGQGIKPLIRPEMPEGWLAKLSPNLVKLIIIGALIIAAVIMSFSGHTIVPLGGKQHPATSTTNATATSPAKQPQTGVIVVK